MPRSPRWLALNRLERSCDFLFLYHPEAQDALEMSLEEVAYLLDNRKAPEALFISGLREFKDILLYQLKVPNVLEVRIIYLLFYVGITLIIEGEN